MSRQQRGRFLTTATMGLERSLSSSDFGRNITGALSSLLPSSTMNVNLEGQKQLSTEQKELLNLLESGKNVYFTGKAGSGKTEVLKRFIANLRRNKVKVGITVLLHVLILLISCY